MNTSTAYSILGFVGDSFLTKDGSLCLAYELSLPEAYSLSEKGIEGFQDVFFRAFSHLKKGFIHRQDTYIRSSFSHATKDNATFLSKSDENYFKGRNYIKHRTILSFTLTNISGLEKAYLSNNFAYKEHLSKQQEEEVSTFLDSVESVVSVLNSYKNIKLSLLDKEGIHQWISFISNGLHDDNGLRDLVFDNRLHIGDKEGTLFALCNESYMPDFLESPIIDTTLANFSKGLFMTELEELGIHLPYTHVVNQVWQFNGRRYYEDIKTRVKNFGKHRDFDNEIKHKYEELEQFQDDVRDDTLCRYHYNIILLEEDKIVLQKGIERVKEIFRNKDFNFYIPSYNRLFELFVGSILGREKTLEKEYSMLLDLKASLCLNSAYSLQKGDKEGVWFNDRIYQIPIQIDLWDEKKKRIPARNSIVVASTGGGKSVTTLNIIQQYIEQGYKVVVVEFGKSFYQLTQLYEEKSFHIDYDGKMPLGINPFYIPNGVPDKDKIRTLVNLILIFWRRPSIMEDTSQVVSLTRLVEGYYKAIGKNHSFTSFYFFIAEMGENLYSIFDINKDYFDLDSFLHICKDFTEGQFYENICKPSELERKILEKDFIVFELTQIKKDPFLVSVIMSILFDTIESKILSDRSVRGLLVFDEYAEAQSIKDKHSGADIHSTVAFCYQKLRKENGAVMTVVQSPAQLPNNEYTQGIISNTQLLFVLPTNNVVYDQTIEKFHIKDSSQIALLRSGKNNFSGKNPYSELYIGFIPDYSTVVRLELSPEKLLAFQTDGEVWNSLQEKIKEGKSLEESIIEKLN